MTQTALASDCVEWSGSLKPNGYGNAYRDGILWSAHRRAWFDTNGLIPKGICVLHRCDNRACVNVDHLFLGTHQDNMDDMTQKGRSHKGRYWLAKTRCPKGHPYDSENTRRYGKARHCRACDRVRKRLQRVKARGGVS